MLGEVEGGFHNAVKTAHMGDHGSGVDLSAAHHGDDLHNVVDVAARVAGDVCGIVMNVIEVEFGREFGLGGACKEIEAAVVTEDCAALFHNGLYGSKTKTSSKPLPPVRPRSTPTGSSQAVFT